MILYILLLLVITFLIFINLFVQKKKADQDTKNKLTLLEKKFQNLHEEKKNNDISIQLRDQDYPNNITPIYDDLIYPDDFIDYRYYFDYIPYPYYNYNYPYYTKYGKTNRRYNKRSRKYHDRPRRYHKRVRKNIFNNLSGSPKIRNRPSKIRNRSSINKRPLINKLITSSRSISKNINRGSRKKK